MALDFKRGFIRAYIVLSVLWILWVLVGWPTWIRIQKEAEPKTSGH